MWKVPPWVLCEDTSQVGSESVLVLRLDFVFSLILGGEAEYFRYKCVRVIDLYLDLDKSPNLSRKMPLEPKFDSIWHFSRQVRAFV